MNPGNIERIREIAEKIYGPADAQDLVNGIGPLIGDYQGKIARGEGKIRFNQEDAILITYGDIVQKEGEAPLKTLSRFLSDRACGLFSTVHILPFFPYSSDDGFSVLDFKRVNPMLGDWEDVREVSREFNLMVDLVVNHISAGSEWFQRFLRNEPPYNDFFICVEEGTDLSRVVRPRALPLLTEVETVTGPRHVWTTFSADQIDLNYRNPKVLLAMLDVLLFYVSQGADLIRLDAVAYIWKEIGTTCIHLPQAHAIVCLMRALLDEVAPWVALITETNVPHAENISYFGDGSNEAQMVYNFSLPPLVLHSFISQDTTKLSRWAETLEVPSDHAAFFNFLASHDGIGVTPSLGILEEDEIRAMVEHVQKQGGKVSFKSTPDGSKSPYELNINYLDALGAGQMQSEPLEMQARRFLTSQAIMLALRGVPGCYFHSLIGSRGWLEGVENQGHARAINREKLVDQTLRGELEKNHTLRGLVYGGFRAMLQQRRRNPAFHPQGKQTIVHLDQQVFALAREAPSGEQSVLCLHNVAASSVCLDIDLAACGLDHFFPLKDLIAEMDFQIIDNCLRISLRAFQSAWLAFHTDSAS